MRHILFYGLAALAMALLALPANAARLALVIGNRDYSAGALKNPINDATAISAALGSLGFQVTPVKNLKRDDIGRTVDGFVSRIRAGDDVVVFYAGHGVQVKGVNYLPAVDANIRVEDDVALNSLNLNRLLERLDEAKSGVRLLLIDACRDNPYSRSFRSGARGLARIEGAPSGTLMHFATRPGGVAADGSGGNGLYTSELLKHLKTPGLSVESMLKRVAADVRKASGGDQQPWTEGALDGEFYFAPAVSAPVVPVVPVQLASVRAEPVVPAAAAPPAPVQPPQPARPAVPGVGQTLKECAQCPELVVLPGGAFTMGSSAAEQALANAGGIKKENTDWENPQHSVSVKSFAAGKYAVTKGEFAQFVSAKSYVTEAEKGDGCNVFKDNKWQPDKAFNWRNVGFKQAEDHPVVCVSWNDAQAYARWVSQISGKPYRLLSEAEREYAARAGSQTAFWWGKSISPVQANYDGTRTSYNGSAKGDWRKATVAVSSFKATPFGLYNMHGNVWEWVEDCFHDNYSGAPSDGSAWTTSWLFLSCSGDGRVLRGGSWNNYPADLRSANRRWGTPGYRDDDSGFRLARTLLAP